ncbi:MAG: hypothetical protein AB1805_13100 [Nitrospirota bacterium]
MRSGAVTIITGTVLLMLSGCATVRPVDWTTADECFEQIQGGLQDKVRTDARVRLREDRWNADAYACLAMAQYAAGNPEFALKSLREAEETIPEEAIDGIHDKLWIHQPELLAEKEYKAFSALAGGDCILRNVTALEGDGSLVLGYFFNPETNKRIRHIRAMQCGSSAEHCAEIDKVCPACTIEEKEAIITIRGYRITSVERLMSDRPIERNLRYIEKILELERAKMQ